jgi:hypothetical protein
MWIPLILKDRATADSFVLWLQGKSIDVKTVFLENNRHVLIGLIMQWLHDVHDIVIHADRSCYIICYGYSDNLPSHILASYPKSKSLYIAEWYAQTEEEVTDITTNISKAIELVLTKLTDPF